MSAPDHSPSGVPLSPGEELEEEPAALSSIESTITARDSELSSLSRVAVAVSTILAEEEDEAGAGRVEQHDLQPVHAILVQLAVSLQARVDQAARDLAAIRHRLARELNRTADVLRNLGEVQNIIIFECSTNISIQGKATVWFPSLCFNSIPLFHLLQARGDHRCDPPLQRHGGCGPRVPVDHPGR